MSRRPEVGEGRWRSAEVGGGRKSAKVGGGRRSAEVGGGRTSAEVGGSRWSAEVSGGRCAFLSVRNHCLHALCALASTVLLLVGSFNAFRMYM